MIIDYCLLIIEFESPVRLPHSATLRAEGYFRAKGYFRACFCDVVLNIHLLTCVALYAGDVVFKNPNICPIKWVVQF